MSDTTTEYVEKGRNTPCYALLPGHAHCVHGHVDDCPDADECDTVDDEGFPYVSWSNGNTWRITPCCEASAIDTAGTVTCKRCGQPVDPTLNQPVVLRYLDRKVAS